MLPSETQSSGSNSPKKSYKWRMQTQTQPAGLKWSQHPGQQDLVQLLCPLAASAGTNRCCVSAAKAEDGREAGHVSQRVLAPGPVAGYSRLLSRKTTTQGQSRIPNRQDWNLCCYTSHLREEIRTKLCPITEIPSSTSDLYFWHVLDHKGMLDKNINFLFA